MTIHKCMIPDIGAKKLVLENGVDLVDRRRLVVIKNVERLISDAYVLLEYGSPASALSTAILAFEEAGKGQRLELGFNKTKRTPSWHHFRQVISAFVLCSSLFQKYGLQLPSLDENVKELLEKRWAGKKRLDEITKEPVPQALRDLILAHKISGFEELSADQLTILRCEMRWVNKIILQAFSGEVEKERQSGMYVDMSDEDDGVSSDPSDILKERAYYWIRIAERTFELLRDGEYRKPYGELATYLEAQPKPLPKGDDFFRLVGDFKENLSDFLTLEDLK